MGGSAEVVGLRKHIRNVSRPAIGVGQLDCRCSNRPCLPWARLSSSAALSAPCRIPSHLDRAQARPDARQSPSCWVGLLRVFAWEENCAVCRRPRRPRTRLGGPVATLTSFVAVAVEDLRVMRPRKWCGDAPAWLFNPPASKPTRCARLPTGWPERHPHSASEYGLRTKVRVPPPTWGGRAGPRESIGKKG